MKKEENVCCIKIGSVSFSVRWTSDRKVPSIYLPFMCRTSDSDAVYTVLNHSRKESLLDTIYWQGALWRMSNEKDDILVDVFNPSCKQWSCAAKMDKSFKSGQFFRWVTSGIGSEDIIQQPVDRVIFVNRLSLAGNVVLHASAVKTSDGVILFCGRSGIGKSTVADIWLQEEGGTLLNDDRAIVFIDGDDVLAGASPWHGKNPTVNPGFGPLLAIFHLGQASETSMQRLPAVLSSAKLLATSAVPFYYKPSVGAVTDAVTNICAMIPSYQLDVFPDKSLPRIVMNTLESCCMVMEKK